MSENGQNDNVFLMLLRGVTLTILVTLLCILIFAIIVRFAMPNESIIKGVNQFLKVFSIFIGVFFSVKGKLGFLKGGIVGIFSTVLTFVLFSLVGGESVSAGAFFIDSLFGLIVGAVCGIIAVNRKVKE
jgi:putative membrane protein (TIGR04086 family)